MFKVLKYLFIYGFCLFLFGCKMLPTLSTSYSDEKVLLDQVNSKAQGDADWFYSQSKKREKISQKYKGELTSGIAVYLEDNLYIYEDKNLTAYLKKITDRLLQGWNGKKPKLSVIIESNEQFNAYVDELNQLHVTTGVFRILENEDQLASVLAHELSHTLLKHNSEKKSVSTASSILEMSGVLAAAVGLKASNKKGNKKYQKQGLDVLLGTQSLGLIWSDVLAPNWSRDNEREADMLGMDLLMRANYNYEELPSIIEKIHDAGVKRSERTQMFNKLSDSLIQKNKGKVYKEGGDKWNKALGDMQVGLVQSLTNSGFNMISSSNKTHESRETRIDALKTYLNTAHGGGELPPESSQSEFKLIVNDSITKSRLNQDKVAIETITAINSNNVASAKTKSVHLRTGAKNSLNSSVIAKSLVDISNRKYTAAIYNLDRLVQKKNAPAEAYIKLAKLYILKNKRSRANEVLNLGVKRIGRDYKFLPTFIYLNKISSNVLVAEESTIKCKKYDAEQKMSFAQKMLSGGKQANSYYMKCASILGYDVIERRRVQLEAKRKQLKAERKQLKAKKVNSGFDLESALKGLFKKK